jgi:toxin ParE1/3/4
MIDILATSFSRFGAATRTRYRALIERALTDLREDPARPGVKAMPEVEAPTCAYYLRHSRERVPAGQRIARPRHVVIFRQPDSETVEIVRVLHDAMDLPHHLDESAGEP